MKINPVTMIDGYKADHRRQYPPGTESVYSNFTPRSTKHLTKMSDNDNKAVFFGLQFFIKDFLIDTWNTEFFQKPRDWVVKRYKRRLDNYLGKDKVPVEHIGELHDLGYLPLTIWALPEGSVTNPKIPQFIIKETNPKFFWLTNYLETVASCYNWKPSTSATTARIYYKLFKRYATITDTPLDFIKFQGHDFSMRGMSGLQDAITSGAGHMLVFAGTDTIPAIDFAEDYYNADSDVELLGCSVAATEHSVMCMGGEDDERATIYRLICDLYKDGIISIVSDTWDFWNVVTVTIPSLKKEIMARNGKVVLRPDSGDPVKTIIGYTWKEVANLGWGCLINLDHEGIEVAKYEGKFYKFKADSWMPEGTPESFKTEEIPECEVKGAIECLWETFGGTKTSTGHKMLDSHIGLIYGDSITLSRAEQILEGLHKKGFASGNVVLGIGSFTYEYVTRDTLGFAMKATAGIINGDIKMIFKKPKTDKDNLKPSAKGYLAVRRDKDGEFVLVDNIPTFEESIKETEFKEVFNNGKLLIDQSYADIRKRVMESV